MAVVTLRSGRVERSAEALGSFPAAGTVGSAVDAEAIEAQRRVLLPLALALLLAVIAGLLFVGSARRRTRRHTPVPIAALPEGELAEARAG